jgi:hypothetical protein
LEHTPRAPDLCVAAWRLLADGGVFIVTAATPPRKPHSAVDGCDLRGGEFYRNVTRGDLAAWLSPFDGAFFDECNQGSHGDIYALAVRLRR